MGMRSAEPARQTLGITVYPCCTAASCAIRPCCEVDAQWQAARFAVLGTKPCDEEVRWQSIGGYGVNYTDKYTIYPRQRSTPCGATFQKACIFHEAQFDCCADCHASLRRSAAVMRPNRGGRHLLRTRSRTVVDRSDKAACSRICGWTDRRGMTGQDDSCSCSVRR